MPIRPRRSVLYMPGTNARALDKARTLPADGLIMDLEDAVAPDSKDAARENVVSALSAGGYGARERVVRVNPFDTQWGRDDFAAVASLPVDAVLLPKINSADDVRRAEAALTAAGAPTDLPVWIMAETPRCILDIATVAAASTRVQVIVMGTSDLSKEMRIPQTQERTGLLPALSQCVMAARANGQEILDGVYLQLQNTTGFQAACRQGRDLGFDGKTLVHPSQIADANQVFGISPPALAEARTIITAWHTAQAEGKGVVVINGRMVENLHVEEARRLLALAEAIAERDSEQ